MKRLLLSLSIGRVYNWPVNVYLLLTDLNVYWSVVLKLNKWLATMKY